MQQVRHFIVWIAKRILGRIPQPFSLVGKGVNAVANKEGIADELPGRCAELALQNVQLFDVLGAELSALFGFGFGRVKAEIGQRLAATTTN